MTHDQPERGDGPDDRVSDGVRAAFKVLGILAALGLVIVVGFSIDFEVRQHEFHQRAQSNKAAATSQAAANAETFYRDLLAVTKNAMPTQSQIHALGLRDVVWAEPPIVQGGSVVVAFEAPRGYTEPGFFGGSHATVLLCYTASVPVAPATNPAATLRQATCLPKGA